MVALTRMSAQCFRLYLREIFQCFLLAFYSFFPSSLPSFDIAFGNTTDFHAKMISNRSSTEIGWHKMGKDASYFHHAGNAMGVIVGSKSLNWIDFKFLMVDTMEGWDHWKLGILPLKLTAMSCHRRSQDSIEIVASSKEVMPQGVGHVHADQTCEVVLRVTKTFCISPSHDFRHCA